MDDDGFDAAAFYDSLPPDLKRQLRQIALEEQPTVERNALPQPSSTPAQGSQTSGAFRGSNVAQVPSQGTNNLPETFPRRKSQPRSTFKAKYPSHEAHTQACNTERMQQQQTARSRIRVSSISFIAGDAFVKYMDGSISRMSLEKFNAIFEKLLPYSSFSLECRDPPLESFVELAIPQFLVLVNEFSFSGTGNREAFVKLFSWLTRATSMDIEISTSVYFTNAHQLLYSFGTKLKRLTLNILHMKPNSLVIAVNRLSEMHQGSGYEQLLIFGHGFFNGKGLERALEKIMAMTTETACVTLLSYLVATPPCINALEENGFQFWFTKDYENQKYYIYSCDSQETHGRYVLIGLRFNA